VFAETRDHDTYIDGNTRDYQNSWGAQDGVYDYVAVRIERNRYCAE
jgi:hypothetical protein